LRLSLGIRTFAAFIAAGFGKIPLCASLRWCYFGRWSVIDRFLCRFLLLLYPERYYPRLSRRTNWRCVTLIGRRTPGDVPRNCLLLSGIFWQILKTKRLEICCLRIC
jgi:hypothetical protein